MTHANAQSVRAAYEAFAAADIDAVSNFIAEDCVWHITASGVLTGDYKGRDAVLGFLGRLMEETGGTFRVETHAVLGDDDHAVALNLTTGTRNGQTFTTKQSAVYHMRDGQTTEAWFFYDDAATIDKFFS